jgi:cytochrome b pre-mRNA-processing protein 3
MKLFRRAAPPEPPMSVLWAAIVAEARDPRWYLGHQVPDTVDGRFDMVALVAILVLLRLEEEGLAQESVWLTERFVEDMDGSLREMGVGDLVVGKHVGNMVGALGGRLGAYRAALEPGAGEDALAVALHRNIFRGRPDMAPAELEPMAGAVRVLRDRIAAVPKGALLEGQL